MAITLPQINITFQQLAGTLVERSASGTAVLLLEDSTAEDAYVVYKNLSAIETDKEKYTETNYQYILDCYGYKPTKLLVARYATGSVATVLESIKNIAGSNCWITLADGKPEDFTALATWIKEQESKKKQYKAIVYKGTALNCKHIVNFSNEKVTFADKRGETTGEKFLPTLLGIIASCNILRGTTYYKCETLTTVTEPEDIDTELGNGKFYLINDGDVVRVGVGINSLTTTNGKTETEDMKYIEVVEAMDLMQVDIFNTFKNEYVGSYRNKYDNQVLFLSAINGYFEQLAEQDVLDPLYENIADVDVETQRKAWIASGKEEAEEWDEQTVKNNAYKNVLFLKGNVKILQSMKDLDFAIDMF